MKAAFAEGHPVTLENIDTFVDGAAVARAGNITCKVCREVLDDIVTVSDAEVCRSLLELYNAKGIVLEPAGAPSVAALELCKDMIAGKNVCCIISGGNNDVARIQDIQRRAQI
ncbi:MAG: pyridoxal-phosphate dependent enzyme [Bacteroidales bacterium]|nr:pyridoxal-phosphate dependent enzyme [Bacteroidales bacterium]